MQRTFAFLKPLGFERHKNEALEMLDSCGTRICEKLVTPTLAQMEQHYAEWREMEFFKDLTEYHAGRPILLLVYEGDDVIRKVRAMCGKTYPKDAAPGTIRALAAEYAPDKESWMQMRAAGKNADNLVHSSDSEEAAAREILLWSHVLVPQTDNAGSGFAMCGTCGQMKWHDNGKCRSCGS